MSIFSSNSSEGKTVTWLKCQIKQMVSIGRNNYAVRDSRNFVPHRSIGSFISSGIRAPETKICCLVYEFDFRHSKRNPIVS